MGDPSDRDWSRPGEDEYLDARIVLRERLLGDPHGQGLSVPAQVRLLASLAGLYRIRGNLPQALQLLQQSMNLIRPLDRPRLLAWHWSHLGLIHADLGEMQAALQACKQAVESQPLEPGAWDCLGEVQLAAGQAEAALNSFRKAGEIAPRDARSWYGLGCVSRQAGRMQEALDAYRKAVRFDPRHAGAWNRLGALYLEMNRPKDALRACRKAVKFAPKNAGCWEGLGQVHFWMNVLPDAIIAYQNAARHDPRNSIFHTTLATLCRLSRQESLAEEQMEIARSLVKDEPEYRQAAFEAASGNTGRALELLGKAQQMKQSGWSSAGFEPVFGPMRDDPRFAALTGKA
jgi:tetratricopeptide (TPR) repeat protein